MKVQKYIRKKGVAVLLLVLSFLIYSCSKEEQQVIKDGYTKVEINLLGVNSTASDLMPGIGLKSSSLSASAGRIAGRLANPSEEMQTTIIPFGDGLSIVATLIPEDVKVSNATTLVASADRSMASQVMASTPEVRPLVEGITYSVYVYGADGAEITEARRSYIHGQEGSSEELRLSTGETYTFVVYSVNSTSALPHPTTKTGGSDPSYSTAHLTNIADSHEFMYFEKTMTLTQGTNQLDVTMKHKFSQIVTTIELDDSVVGNITEIGVGSAITPTYSMATDFKFSDQLVNYGTALNANGTSVVFPTVSGVGVRTISSVAANIISPEIIDGEFKLASLTVSGTKKENIVLRNLKITPGHRYTLKLKVQSPCTENVSNVNFGWNQVPVLPQGAFSAPAADYGFTFDIWTMDNSFNMTINNIPLIKDASDTKHELQFEPDQAGHPQNVRFVSDKAMWPAYGETDTIDPSIKSIWDIQGIAGDPAIRVVIGPDGDVFLYGRRTMSSPLEPLELFDGYVFNNIPWNKTSDNAIVVSQDDNGATHMTGNGTGRKIIPCP